MSPLIIFCFLWFLWLQFVLSFFRPIQTKYGRMDELLCSTKFMTPQKWGVTLTHFWKNCCYYLMAQFVDVHCSLNTRSCMSTFVHFWQPVSPSVWTFFTDDPRWVFWWKCRRRPLPGISRSVRSRPRLKFKDPCGRLSWLMSAFERTLK